MLEEATTFDCQKCGATFVPKYWMQLIQKILVIRFSSSIEGKLLWVSGSGCGSGVASNTRGLQFESRHWHNFIMNKCTVNCRKEKDKRKKVAGKAPEKS